MQNSIASVLRMWPYSAGRAEVFVNALLSYVGYPRLENVAPLGGRDGGRDLQSLDGTLRVACYFPIKEFKPYDEIEAKFLSDMEKAQKGGAESFTFVTGQVLQLAEKLKLKNFSFTKDTSIYDCNDILNVVSAPEAGFLRAELGFPDTKKSHDQDFFEILFSTVIFSKLIHLFNQSSEPKIFPSGFFEIFDALNIFRQTAQPGLLSDDLKNVYLNWGGAVDGFHLQLLELDQFDYRYENHTLIMKSFPYDEFQGVSDAVNTAFSDLVEYTMELAKFVEEKLRLPIR
ncbi:hypothetical protein [Pseudomonas putida]|uniref:Uncharacterized protein n=1 Tax=Pseudomonas putida TaxID=303 RepID=A0A1Q9QZK5_PSEPU|nr:hypothetical protein [Pseudomonas putida]OLS60555.1 hypothetical protein PSEMO_45980 [Pseudomonas putida]